MSEGKADDSFHRRMRRTHEWLDETLSEAESLVRPHLTDEGFGVFIDRVERFVPEEVDPLINHARVLLILQENLRRADESGDIQRVRDAAILLGAMAATLSASMETNQFILQVIDDHKNTQAGRKKGGANSRKLTPEVRYLALNIIDEYLPTMTQTEACTQAQATLEVEHEIEVSVSSLMGLLRKRKKQ